MGLFRLRRLEVRPTDRTQAGTVAKEGGPLETRVPAPETREQVRRNEPNDGDREERRRRDAVQQDRQAEDERDHEAEHDVRAADDNEHHVAHGAMRRVHQRGAREAEERATHLGARTGFTRKYCRPRTVRTAMDTCFERNCLSETRSASWAGRRPRD